MYELTIKEGYKAELVFTFEGFENLSTFLERAIDADFDKKYTYEIKMV